MTNLEDYLATDFHEEKRILGDIDGLINGVVRLLLDKAKEEEYGDKKYSVWESYIKSTKKNASSSESWKVSDSTSAMAYHSLLMCSGHIKESVLNPYGRKKIWQTSETFLGY